MKQLRCLVVDDEPNAVALLSSYINQVPQLELSGACYNAVEAIAFLRDYEVDVIFLDIEIPGINGMELSLSIPAFTDLVFTTAFSQYAVESYERNAVDYLLKPISFKRFMQAVNKIQLKRANHNTDSVLREKDSFTFFKSGRKVVRLNYDDILYVNGMKEYVQIVTETEKLMVYKRMKQLQEELPPYFKRIHNSYIVNIKHITRIEENHVWIKGLQLNMSDSYRTAFMNFIDAGKTKSAT